MDLDGCVDTDALFLRLAENPLLFAGGFESGGTGAWSNTVP